MRRISDSIARLAATRPAMPLLPGTGADRLDDVPAFGSNPGQLRARQYVPGNLRPGAPLVVVLHGCTQSASGYDDGSGWSTLADRHGFALLYPEQQRSNNANLCFNWFVPADIERGSGEALSIRQMVEKMLDDHALDPARVFVTGLSAGGAMTSVMLATYPDVFAGGAIIAGLPYGSAVTLPAALERMRGIGAPGAARLGALVREASPHRGPWPTISVWHGTGDQVVAISNLGSIIDQWCAVHGLERDAFHAESVDGHDRRVWRGADGRACIEAIIITAMGHGTPIAPRGADGCGIGAPYFLDVGVSSSARIAAFWGIDGETAAYELVEPPRTSSIAASQLVLETVPPAASAGSARPEARGGINLADVINDALRAAGLLR